MSELGRRNKYGLWSLYCHAEAILLPHLSEAGLLEHKSFLRQEFNCDATSRRSRMWILLQLGRYDLA